MPTLTFPLSRIEGHAQVVIEVQGGKVVSARFQAMEFRGFKYLAQGVPAEQMAVIVPRICGVCSTAHHVAAVKTLEDAYGVTPPPLALKIRELLLLGQIVQNQATSLFIFTMPDRLGIASIFQAAEEAGADEAQAVLATRVLSVRKVGTDLIATAGGQFIHPVKAVVGGVTSGIGPEAAAAMRDEVAAALPVVCELFDYYWEQSLALSERIGTWGDDAPACYIAAVTDTRPNYTGGNIRVMCSDGVVLDSFPARDFRSHLTYEETDYSYAGRTSYGGDVIRANSLARGIELVYALERAMEILAKPLDGEDTDVGYTPRDGEGYGLVEAPRGPLIHRYVIENDLIAEAEFIIPTVHNVMAIERALRVAAERYITPEQVDMELEHAVGRVVRAFDPCIACATH